MWTAGLALSENPGLSGSPRVGCPDLRIRGDFWSRQPPRLSTYDLIEFGRGWRDRSNRTPSPRPPARRATRGLLRADLRGSRFGRPPSSARTSAPALTTCARGDVLVVLDLDRLGRRAGELITLVDELDQRGIGFRALNTPMGHHHPGGPGVSADPGRLRGDGARPPSPARSRGAWKAARARGA